MKIKLFEKKAFLNAMVDTAVLVLIAFPFSTYLHRCNKCEHVIMESE